MKTENMTYEEKVLKAPNGIAVFFFGILLYVAALAGMIYCGIKLDDGTATLIHKIGMGASLTYICLGWVIYMGIKVIRPNEALVLTLFGKYVGTLKNPGIFFVNPFCVGVAPSASSSAFRGLLDTDTLQKPATQAARANTAANYSKKISLKAMTLDNKKQKINDEMGNPIEVGIVVIWKIINTAKAVFNVDDYYKFVSTQADSALRDVVRLYPYDISANGDEKSLRGSAQEVAESLRIELQSRVEIAGVEIIEARITHLAYAPEIAAAMLQRQQATAIIEARQKIVEGAVGMVQMALNKLSEDDVCELDDERKAQMVSNLLVVLCGNKDAQPIVNSGTIY